MQNNKEKFIREFKSNNDINVIEDLLKEQSSSALENELNELKLQNNAQRVINFELLNSYLDINIFHNIYINDLKFDFIIICDNFICNITALNFEENFNINEYGEISLLEDNIGNPFLSSIQSIKQLKCLLQENKIIKDLSTYSLIVNTNKSSKIINDKSPEYIKKCYINSDDLVSKIDELNNQKNTTNLSNKTINKIIEFILLNNKEVVKDYESNIKKTSLENTIDTAKDSFSSTIKNIKRFSKEASNKYEIFSNQKSKEIMESIEANND